MTDKDKVSFNEASESSNTFCMYPFVHLNFKVDGAVAPCFRSAPIDTSDSDNMGWNGDAWKTLRKDLLNDNKPKTCESCWKLERAGVPSYRQASLADRPPFNGWHDVLDNYNPETGEMTSWPKQIELRFSNLCNFQCRMCGPLYSSKWETFLNSGDSKAERVKADMGGSSIRRPSKGRDGLDYQAKLLEALNKASDSLQYLMIAGGEPLLQQEHYQALEILKSRGDNIVLEYSTNLSTLSYKNIDVIDLWKHFKGIILKVSIDGDPQIYSHVRKYGKIETLTANIKRVQNEPDLKLIKFLGTLTTSAYNVARILESVEFFTEMGLFFHTSQVEYPLHVNSQVLPIEEKKRVTERVSKFLSELEKNMDPIFSRNPFWQDQANRDRQLYRIREFVKASIDFMNHADKSDLFHKFLTYDHLLDKNEDENILNLYPHWKNYLTHE